MPELVAQHDPWFRLDNAGKIFSSISTRRITTLFRLSCTLKRPVRVAELQAALEALMPRFPYFAVHLRPGFFWYHLAMNRASPQVVEDRRFPCMDYELKKRGTYPFRVRVYHRRIAVEFAHAVTDGTGALAFLRALVAEYLRRLGVVPQEPNDLMRPGDELHPEEFEDAFRRYWQPGIPPPRRETPAFHLPHPLEPKGVYHVTTGIVSVQKMRDLSRAEGVSMGELLIADYLHAFQEVIQALPPRVRSRLQRPIRIDVPVNLRQHFPSRTMRNFFLPVLPSIDPRLGDYSFAEILRRVHHYMRSEIDDKYLKQQMGRNVRAEINPLIRVVPLVIKDWALSVVYDVMAQGRTSSGLSNLGRVTLPSPLEEHVERFEFIPPPPTARRVSCGVVSFGDNLYITFGRTMQDPLLEAHFFRLLAAQGMAVRIESNQFR